MEEKMKFCKHCGEKIPYDAILCIKCGRQVEALSGNTNPQLVINNVANSASSSSASSSSSSDAVVASPPAPRHCNKWVSFILCLLFGYVGAHKFYEGKTGTGLLYLCTVGLFGIGWLIDTINLLGKPDPYVAS